MKSIMYVAVLFACLVSACGGRTGNEDLNQSGVTTSIGGSSTISSSFETGGALVINATSSSMNIEATGGTSNISTTLTITSATSGSSATSATGGNSMITTTTTGGSTYGTGGSAATGGKTAISTRAPGSPCAVTLKEQDGLFYHGLEASPNGFMVLRRPSTNDYRGQFWNLDGTPSHEESLQGLTAGGSFSDVSLLLGSEDGFLFSTTASGLNPDIPRLIRHNPQGNFVKSIQLWSGLNAIYGKLIAFRSEGIWDKILFEEDDSEIRDGSSVQTVHYGSQIISSNGEFGKTNSITTEQRPGSYIQSATSPTKDSYGFLKAYSDSLLFELGLYDTIYGTYRNVSIGKILASSQKSDSIVQIRNLLSVNDQYAVVWDLYQQTAPETIFFKQSCITYVSTKGTIGDTIVLPTQKEPIGIRFTDGTFWFMDQRGENDEVLVLVEMGIDLNIRSETTITNSFKSDLVDGFGSAGYQGRFAFGWSQLDQAKSIWYTQLAFVDCR